MHIFNQSPEHYYGQGTPYVYSIDYTTLTGASLDTLVVGATTYTYQTDFFAPSMTNPGAQFNVYEWVKALAAAINGDLSRPDFTTKLVWNGAAWAKAVGKKLVIVGRVPGLALTVTPTINGAGASVATEFTGVKQYS